MIQEQSEQHQLYTYQFTPANLYDIVDSTAPRTWEELAKSVCPEILQTYPKNSYIKQYRNNLIALDVSFKFKFEGKIIRNTWKIFKNHEDFIKIHSNLIKKKIIPANMNNNWVNKKPQQMLSMERINENYQIYYAEYLNELTKIPQVMKLHDMLEFIEHCLPQDKYYLDVSGQVWFSMKPTNTILNKFYMFCCCTEGSRQRKYLTLTKDAILISERHFEQGKYEEVIIFSNTFSLKFDRNQKNGDYMLTIKANHTVLDGHFMNFEKLLSAAVKIGYSYQISNYSKTHKFGSFSPIRNNCGAKMYIDGESYFSDLCDKLYQAKRKVCITGWIISPYFYLKRKTQQHNINDRLDKALLHAARNGVKIFILVYHEPQIISHNDSRFVQTQIQTLHKNIIVLRHPNLVIPSQWTHHEKIVIIDEQIGFLGGLDIAFGRWDNKQHLLTNGGNLWPGADYCNIRIQDIIEPREYEKTNLNPDTQPRCPWHDLHVQVEGQIVIDLQRHFTQYWHFAIHQLHEHHYNPKAVVERFKQKIQFLSKKETEIEQFSEEEIKTEVQIQIQQKFIKEYQSSQSNNKIQEFFVKTKEYLNFVINQKLKHKFHELIVDGYFARKQPAGDLRMQLIRSSSDWSIGLEENMIQCSIQNAYIQLIKDSKNYIYIENQFFMFTQNQVVNALASRILKAYEQKTPFKVIVIMPLEPGFTGKVDSKNSDILKHEMHLQYQSIKYRGDSLMNQLSSIPNIKDYLYFFGLRNHGVLKQGPKTEQIYVHSKMMLIDDQTILIGSANINDRSLLGSRDSEIAVVIETKQSTDKIAKRLRQQLFREHFDMDQQENFLTEQNWKKLLAQSAKNTQLYREVFGCMPDNTVSKFKQIKELEKKSDKSSYTEKMSELKGYVVDFPIDFLNKENLAVDFRHVQFYFQDALT